MIPPLPPARSREFDWHGVRLYFNGYGRSSKWPTGHRLSREWFKGIVVDFTFWFFFEGRGELIDHRTGRSHPLHAGVCLCMRPGMDLEVRQSDPHALGDAYFHLDFQLGKRRLQPKQWPKLPFYSEITDISFFDQTTRRILALLHQMDFSKQMSTGSKEGGELLAAELLFKGLMVDLQQGYRRQGRSGTPLHHERVISEALSVLFAEPQRFSTVGKLASFCGYSEGHFRVLCQQITGESPGKLLIKARIEQAKKYLRHSELTIGMIAETLGYENIYYFSEQFHTITGMTAKEYRKKRF